MSSLGSVGTVVAVMSSRCRVLVDTTTLDLPYLVSYLPRVGDLVTVNASVPLVIGKVTSA